MLVCLLNVWFGLLHLITVLLGVRGVWLLLYCLGLNLLLAVYWLIGRLLVGCLFGLLNTWVDCLSSCWVFGPLGFDVLVCLFGFVVWVGFTWIVCGCMLWSCLVCRFRVDLVCFAGLVDLF